MSTFDPIDRFFESPSFGVVGASSNPKKYGNRVLKKYWEMGLIAYPVHPSGGLIVGQPSFKTVLELPPETMSISVITQPFVTEQVVRQAVEKGIRNVWMQPGAESPQAVSYLEANGINVIADGSCVIVVLGIRFSGKSKM
jgi:predicted CoA-binding protein